MEPRNYPPHHVSGKKVKIINDIKRLVAKGNEIRPTVAIGLVGVLIAYKADIEVVTR